MHQQAGEDLAKHRERGLTWSARRLWTQRNGIHADCMDERLTLEVVTAGAADPALRARWQGLVEAGQNGHKVYQLPAYFDAICASDEGAARVELLTVTRARDRQLVAVVPVRLAPWQLHFAIGPLSLWRRRMVVINLLGSVPAGTVPMPWLTGQALALFPEASAVLMHAVPMHAGVWQTLSAGRQEPIRACLLSNWRACHTMAVPANVEDYMQQFSSKKRYNLRRQMRQLAQACGPLSLERVEREADVAVLAGALVVLAGAGDAGKCLRRTTLEALARNGLLLCYVLRAGDKITGAIVGTRSADVLHIHNIFVDDTQRHLSAGTTAMQLAMEDIISMACFKLIDFGYGTPRHEFSSSHMLETRAQVAVMRRADAVGHLFTLYRGFHVLTEQLISWGKPWLAAWRARRTPA